jgi:hypothetical protein
VERDFKEVFLEDCPGCSATIYFEYQTSTGINCPVFKDYKVTGLTLNNCNGCSMTGAEIFEYSIHWLLKFGPIDPPEENHCDSNYRVVNAACWRMMNDNEYHPCTGSGCCWSRYVICNPLRPEDPEKIGQSINDTIFCEVTNACMFMCDNNMPRIALPQDEGEIKSDKSAKAVLIPNPNNCDAVLKVENAFSGDIVIEISNPTGEIVMKETYLKRGFEINVNLSIKNCVSGTYFYRILQNGISIGQGSFVVIK